MKHEPKRMLAGVPPVESDVIYEEPVVKSPRLPRPVTHRVVKGELTLPERQVLALKQVLVVLQRHPAGITTQALAILVGLSWPSTRNYLLDLEVLGYKIKSWTESTGNGRRGPRPVWHKLTSKNVPEVLR